MSPTAKLLILAGVVLIVAGLLWQFGSRCLMLGRLPGDIVIDRDNVKIYIPIATSIVLSVLLTLAFSLWRWLQR